MSQLNGNNGGFMAETRSSTPFEIGLVMAGAISAGSYTAGVLVFLIQALNEWEKARIKDPENVPAHDVRLKVVAGASAGGMTGAIMAALLNEAFHPMTSLQEWKDENRLNKANKLYKAWVEQINIEELLRIDDLKNKHHKVISLLDSTILDSIATQALTFTPTHNKPTWLSDSFHLFLTLTNLQGIPYDIRFNGSSGTGDYIIEEHGDFAHFVMDGQPPVEKQAIWLPSDDPDHPNWQLLKNAALATGAFPVGLAPRFMNRPFTDYDNRTQKIPQSQEKSNEGFECHKTISIKPSWPGHHQKMFHFAAVDGGVMDNEPFDLAHDFLAGEQHYNVREPDRVNRAILMIDPFPNTRKNALLSEKEFDSYGIMEVLGQLFSSLLDQARFKPDELILAASPDVYSRFLIAPTRRTENGYLAKYPIASGSLSGFGGFLSKQFRIHDYQLGRRNCQQFLRRHFVIPVEKARMNPVFASYTASDWERFTMIFDDGVYIPIIPLTGNATEPVLPVSWNETKIKMSDIMEWKKPLTQRTKIVTNRLVDEYITHSFTKMIIKMVLWLKRAGMIDTMIRKIEDELNAFELLKN